MMTKLSNDQLAFFIARISIGINFLLHGLIRIPKLQDFVRETVKEFEGSYLPLFSVTGFAYALPFIELVIGLMLLLGFKTRFFAATGAFLIVILIFGSGIKEDWSAVGTQMVYALFFFILIKNLNYNVLAVDSKPIKTVDGFKTKR